MFDRPRLNKLVTWSLLGSVELNAGKCPLSALRRLLAARTPESPGRLALLFGPLRRPQEGTGVSTVGCRDVDIHPVAVGHVVVFFLWFQRFYTVGVEPPSMRKVVPVMKSVSGLARKQTAAAISIGCPSLLTVWWMMFLTAYCLPNSGSSLDRVTLLSAAFAAP
jgi:hypothetical protein